MVLQLDVAGQLAVTKFSSLGIFFASSRVGDWPGNVYRYEQRFQQSFFNFF
jgi:hypothetical protein